MEDIRSVGQVIAILRRRFWLMLAIVVVGCVVSVWIALAQPRLYEATAAVQIRGAAVQGESVEGTGAMGRQIQLIERRLMARDNLTELIDTYRPFAEAGDLPMMEQVGLMRDAIRLTEIDSGAPAWQPDRAGPSGLIITVRLADPQTAADVANALMSDVLTQSRRQLLEKARTELQFFAGEEERVGREIAELEARIAAFKRDNADALPEGVASLREQLAGLRETELEIERQMIVLDSGSTRQRAEVLGAQIERLAEQKRLVSARVAEMEAAIAAAPAVERELSALNRRLSQLQERYGVVTRRRAEAEMAQMLEDRQISAQFEVLETALPPEFAVSRSRRKVALAGGVASLLLAAMAAALLEMTDSTIRSAAQLERELGMRPVVSIPTIRTRWQVRRRRLLAVLALVLAAVGLPVLLRLMGQASPALRDMSDRLPELIRP